MTSFFCEKRRNSAVRLGYNPDKMPNKFGCQDEAYTYHGVAFVLVRNRQRLASPVSRIPTQVWKYMQWYIDNL
jgi:hypothetical protein